MDTSGVVLVIVLLHQVDNQLPFAVYPQMFYPLPPPPTVASTAGIGMCTGSILLQVPVHSKCSLCSCSVLDCTVCIKLVCVKYLYSACSFMCCSVLECCYKNNFIVLEEVHTLCMCATDRIC